MDSSKKKKLIFDLSIVINYITIFVYQFLTPYLMDDLNYARQATSATNIAGLFVQEYEQYMNWTGRSVAHIMVRFFLYLENKMIFNITASAVFVILTLLIYENVKHKERYDTKLYVFIVLLVWIFAERFDQTILWETGACNYLFTTTIILGFMTLFHKKMQKADEKQTGIIASIGMLLFGITAGWCSENTSGACALFLMVLIFRRVLKVNKDKAKVRGRKPIDLWMVLSLLGVFIGMAVMVMSPGNKIRGAFREEGELHSGIVGMAARFMNLTIMIHDSWLILIAFWIIAIVYLRYQNGKLSVKELIIGSDHAEENNEAINSVEFFLLFVITSYVLIATVTPQSRALFGAGIFLITAAAQAWSAVNENSPVTAAAKNALLYVMLMGMGFSYLGNGASLARIYREEQERYAYLEQKAEEGVKDVTVPKLRPQFHTRYSAAYECDVEIEPDNWINVMYADYYGFDTVSGVERENWEYEQ